MSNMNKQTCTLKQAVKLKELGIAQDFSCMVITYYKDTMKYHVNRRETALQFYRRAKIKFGSNCNSVLVSVYDAEELFILLKDKRFSVWEEDGEIALQDDHVGQFYSGKTLAEVLANLLIWQLEHK